MPSLTIDLIVDDQGAVTIKNATRNVQDLTAETGKLGSSMTSAFGAVGKQAASIAAAWLSVEGAVRLAHAAVQSVDMGAKVLQAEEAFNHVSRAVGVYADQMIASLKRVTAGTVDSAELMQKSMKFMSAGMDPSKVVQLGEVARLAARRMGVDVGEAYSDIGDAVETMRTRALRAYGLITADQMKLMNSAKAAGVEVDAMRIIMENFGRQKDLMGPPLDNASEKLQRFTASLKEARAETGKFLAGIVTMLLPDNPAGKPVIPGLNAPRSATAGAPPAPFGYAAGVYGGIPAPADPSYEDQLKKAVDAEKMRPILQAFESWEATIQALNPDLSQSAKEMEKLNAEADKLKDKKGGMGMDPAKVNAQLALAQSYLKRMDELNPERTFTPSDKAAMASGKAQSSWQEESERRAEALLKQYDDLYTRYSMGRVSETQLALARIEEEEIKAKGELAEVYNSSEWDYANATRRKIVTAEQYSERLRDIEAKSAADRAGLTARQGAQAASNRATEATTYYQSRAAQFVGTPAENIGGEVKALQDKIASLQEYQAAGNLDPKEWEALQKAIDEATKALTPLQVKLIEASGTMQQGLAGGLRQWAYQAQTAYGAGAEMVTGTANAMTRGLSTFFDYSSKGWMNYKTLATSVLHDIYMEMMKAMTERPIVNAAMSAMGMASPGTGGGGSAGGGFGLLGMIPGFARFFGGGAAGGLSAGEQAMFQSQQEADLSAGFFHSGGTVGEGGTFSRVPAHLFEHAARYHSGGIAGDEVPAILQKGERVSRAGASGPPSVSFQMNVTNNNNSKVTATPPRWDSAAKSFVINTLIEDHVNDGDYRQARRTWGDNT